MTVEEMKAVDIWTVSRDDLADIRDVVIGQDAPKEERIKRFLCRSRMTADLEARLQEMETVRDDGTKAMMETMERFSGAMEPDQKIMEALIEKVPAYDLEHVEIRRKFSDEALKLLKG